MERKRRRPENSKSFSLKTNSLVLSMTKIGYRLLMSDISSSFDSNGNMDMSMKQNAPARQSVHLSKGKLFKRMTLSPLKSSSGSNLENVGLLIVRKRQSLGKDRFLFSHSLHTRVRPSLRDNETQKIKKIST